MTDKRYYIAYGSNLNVGQMRMRCPHATILGTANLKGWELLFKGSKTGSYLTIEESEGGTVPVVIWEVTATDEAALDRYEGFPSYYIKEEWPVHMGDSSEIKGMIYIMNMIRQSPPHSSYYKGIEDAYRKLGLRSQIKTVLEPALERSLQRGTRW